MFLYKLCKNSFSKNCVKDRKWYMPNRPGWITKYIVYTLIVILRIARNLGWDFFSWIFLASFSLGHKKRNFFDEDLAEHCWSTLPHTLINMVMKIFNNTFINGKILGLKPHMAPEDLFCCRVKEIVERRHGETIKFLFLPKMGLLRSQASTAKKKLKRL